MLAYNLKKLMLNSGISSKKLSDILKINRSTLIKILNGTTPNPRIETIHTIANYFKISAHELIGGGETKAEEFGETPLPGKIKETILKLMEYSDIKTPKVLSNLSGIPYSVIEDVLLDKTTVPNINTLKKFANFFNVSVTQLLGFEEYQHLAPLTTEEINIPVFSSDMIQDFSHSSREKLVPINHVRSFRKNNTNNIFAFVITTDSLRPDFSRDELLFIDAKELPRMNDFILAKVDGNTNIFECINIGTDFIYLKTAGTFDAKKFNKSDVKFLGVIIQKILN